MQDLQHSTRLRQPRKLLRPLIHLATFQSLRTSDHDNPSQNRKPQHGRQEIVREEVYGLQASSSSGARPRLLRSRLGRHGSCGVFAMWSPLVGGVRGVVGDSQWYNSLVVAHWQTGWKLLSFAVPYLDAWHLQGSRIPFNAGKDPSMPRSLNHYIASLGTVQPLEESEMKHC